MCMFKMCLQKKRWLKGVINLNMFDILFNLILKLMFYIQLAVIPVQQYFSCSEHPGWNKMTSVIKLIQFSSSTAFFLPMLRCEIFCSNIDFTQAKGFLFFCMSLDYMYDCGISGLLWTYILSFNQWKWKIHLPLQINSLNSF